MLGQFLRTLRQAKGLTQKQAGERAKLTQERVCALEKTVNPYDYGRLKAYVEGLGYDLELHVVDRENKANRRVL